METEIIFSCSVPTLIMSLQQHEILLFLLILQDSLCNCFFFFFLRLCWVIVALRKLFLVAASGGYSSVVRGLLFAVASLLVEYGLWGMWASVAVVPRLQSRGSVLVEHQLNCPMACVIFLDLGSNTCSLYWQVERSPRIILNLDKRLLSMTIVAK